jgi:hypothetical protein
MTTVIRMTVAGVLAVWVLALPCHALVTSVDPLLPTAGDSTYVFLQGYLGGGDQILDSSVRVSHDTVAARVSIEPCTGPCPMSLRTVRVRLNAGTLAAGTYRLLTITRTIFDTSSTRPADTTTDTSRTSFTVYPATTSPTRLVASYATLHGIGSDTGSYYYTNGDTLSVVGLHADQCCAQHKAAAYVNGDSVVVVFADTSEALCDCMASSSYCLTAALSPAPVGNPKVVLKYRSAYASADETLYRFTADHAASAVCLSVQDSTNPGFRLFVDTSWFRYEIVSPVVSRLATLRLQPNPAFPAFAESHLYLDDIAVDTASAPALSWAPVSAALDTLDDFEHYYAGDWQVVGIRDSSVLNPYWVLYNEKHLLEVSYSNHATGSESNYMWKSLGAATPVHSLTRIQLWATTKAPEGATASRLCPRPVEGRSNCTGISHAVQRDRGVAVGVPGYMQGGECSAMLLDGRGRCVASSRTVRASATLMLPVSDVRPGVYVLRVVSAKAAAESRAVFLPR